MSNKLTTFDMLNRLQYSKNGLVAAKSKQILSGNLDAGTELKTSGIFMREVLTGNYEGAISRADDENLIVLINPLP